MTRAIEITALLALGLAVACGDDAAATGGVDADGGVLDGGGLDNGVPDAGPDPSCDDGAQNQDETDVDCGGVCGATCVVGESCGDAADCMSDLCEAGVCTPLPTCDDGVQNAAESDVDCGGGVCDACASGLACGADADCASAFCDAGTCADAVCGNGVAEGDAEACDDGVGGTPAESATCDVDCTDALCGDGLVNATAGEACDGDGAGTGGETVDCNADCTLAACGDGVVNAAAGEACDGDGVGTGGETETCNADCSASVCGDGILNVSAGEECDDGTDLCSATCEFAAPDVTVVADATFDTDTGLLNGVAVGTFDAATGVLSAGEFTVDEGVTLTVVGERPFQVRAGSFDVAGTVDASGQDGEANGDDCAGPGGAGGRGGPGGGRGGDGASPGVTIDGFPGEGTGFGGGGLGDDSGGGGAGHLTAGTQGDDLNGTGGSAGIAYSALTTLEGGSGGGGGSVDDDAPTGTADAGDDAAGGGGGGGGTVFFETPGRLVVTGRIDVSGGEGGDSTCSGGSGGGGSGGTVLLDAGRFLDVSEAEFDLAGGSGATGGRDGGDGARGELALPGDCTDGITNQDETDVDCGGATCGACADALGCDVDADCASALCGRDAVCLPATCGNGALDAGESDVDCGGTACDGCLGGLACTVFSDCASETCAAGVCEAPTGFIELIGHDYFASNPDVDRILGNAVLRTDEARIIEVVIYDEFADTFAGGEVARMETIITDQLAAARRTVTFTRLSDSTSIGSVLTPSVDVFLIAEQEDGDVGPLRAAGTLFTRPLTEFLRRGGVILSTHHVDPGFEVLDASGLMTIEDTQNITGDDVTVVDSSAPLMAGVSSPYVAANGSCSFTGITQGTVLVETAAGAPVVVEFEAVF